MTQQHIPALTRTFDTLPRCTAHAGELVTSEGECPRCARETHAARVRTADDEREGRKLHALTRVGAVKQGSGRRRMSDDEATRIAGCAQ